MISKSNKKIQKIFSDIKSIKIHGATNIAKAAIEAYSLTPTKQTKRTLESLRPTEPMLQNSLKALESGVSEKQILNHFSQAQDLINKHIIKLIKNKDVIFTHCHSTNVIKSLIYAKNHDRNFKIYNTETRPLFQGRKTALELSKARIKVITFVDSAAAIAIKQSDAVFLGADALLKNGDVMNKVGSGMFAEIAQDNKVPVYIIADSWKFTKKNLDLEQRKAGEVWDYDIPKHIKIRNPAFEKILSKNIRAIVSELGVLTPKEFVRMAGKA